MTYRWWEKTVEYAFIVKSHSALDLVSLTPFDDKAERIGDAILWVNLHYLIIEFKMDEYSFPKEHSKYYKGKAGFLKAQKELALIGEHHLVIWGELDERKQAPELILKYQEYFCHANVKQDLAEVIQSGTTKKNLDSYLTKFLRHKDKTGGKGGGQGMGYAESLVIGVDTATGKAIVLKVDEYQKIFPPPQIMMLKLMQIQIETALKTLRQKWDSNKKGGMKR